MTDNEIYERIDQYLSGRLSPDELSKFEQEIRVHPLLKKQIQKQALAHQLLIENRLHQAKESIQKYTSESSRFNFTRWLLGGITFIGLVGSIVLVTTKSDQPASLSVLKIESKPQPSIPNISTQPSTKTTKEIDNNRNTTFGFLSRSKDNSRSTSHNEVLNEDTPIVESTTSTHKETELPLKEKETITSKENPTPCLTTLLFDTKIEATCLDQATGSIDIHSIIGGHPPYQYSRDGGQSFQTKSSFVFLESSTYSVVVKDNNGCISKRENITVSSKNCSRTKEYIFNPSQGEVWKFPIENFSIKRVTILNRSGTTVFQSTPSSGIPEAWDGKDLYNNYSEVGLHYFLIEYSDGNSIEGYVTIVM
ncbi:MAG: hypothetical protein MUE33_02210 [Cytophagaceae bacterium]|jgi:hypothetical protein|nr:hypothetical protein [Cytophagaceae bacterium]